MLTEEEFRQVEVALIRGLRGTKHLNEFIELAKQGHKQYTAPPRTLSVITDSEGNQFVNPVVYPFVPVNLETELDCAFGKEPISFKANPEDFKCDSCDAELNTKGPGGQHLPSLVEDVIEIEKMSQEEKESLKQMVQTQIDLFSKLESNKAFGADPLDYDT